MDKPKITYKQLGKELEDLGWKAELIETGRFGVKRKSTIYRNSKTDLYIILPRAKPTKHVDPAHVIHVRSVLEHSGFWNSILKQTKTETRQEAIDVLQTLAGIGSMR
jgi:hypothetical protein